MIRERSLSTGEVRKKSHVFTLILMLEGDGAVNYNNIYKWQDASMKSLIVCLIENIYHFEIDIRYLLIISSMINHIA